MKNAKYNYDNMSNISDVIGKQVRYSEAFTSALGENVSTPPETMIVESMTDPENTNGGVIHWLSFGNGRGIYLEEPQIIDLLNDDELNITVNDKIITLALLEAPSSVTYESGVIDNAGIPTAEQGIALTDDEGILLLKAGNKIQHSNGVHLIESCALDGVYVTPVPNISSEQPRLIDWEKLLKWYEAKEIKINGEECQNATALASMKAEIRIIRMSHHLSNMKSEVKNYRTSIEGIEALADGKAIPGNAESFWNEMNDEQRNKALAPYKDAIDSPNDYRELSGKSWDELSDNVKEILRIAQVGDGAEVVAEAAAEMGDGGGVKWHHPQSGDNFFNINGVIRTKSGIELKEGDEVLLHNTFAVKIKSFDTEKNWAIVVYNDGKEEGWGIDNLYVKTSYGGSMATGGVVHIGARVKPIERLDKGLNKRGIIIAINSDNTYDISWKGRGTARSVPRNQFIIIDEKKS